MEENRTACVNCLLDYMVYPSGCATLLAPMQLNNHQTEAVHHFGSPLLIIAGAGAGKTMVLTHKIKFMITELGIYPDHILAITFTNKAAKEMKERVRSLLPGLTTYPFLGTFHSFCNEVLRKEIQYLGRSQSFIIMDYSDQTRLVKQLLKSLNIDDKKYPPAYVLSQLDRIKNTLTTVSGYERDSKKDPVISNLYHHYQQHLETQNLVDFNDLLFLTVRIWNQFPDILEKYQDQFPVLLVDEYQDTNHAQWVLIQLLAKKFRNICAVGDFDQTIYSWRGASVQNILQFETNYPDATVIKLEENYRSTGTILSAANTLISNNSQRKEKTLWTKNNLGDPVTIFCGTTEREEAFFIGREITKRVQANEKLSNIAILYRTNSQSRVIEEVLTQLQINYRVVGGLKFFQRAEIKDIGSYLRVLYNPHDNAALIRAISVPSRGIGDTSIDRLLTLSTQTGKSIFELHESSQIQLGPRQTLALTSFFDLISDVKKQVDSTPAEKNGLAIRCILEQSGYKDYLLSGAVPNGADKLESIYELINLSNEEELELGEFLGRLSLSSDWDEHADSNEEVTLMTLHHAKGLEFDIVFLAGLEEGLLPHFRSQSEDEIEEERRLCYVGITRGRRQVILTSAQKRLFHGELKLGTPSRFLKEIPTHLCQQIGIKSINPAPTPVPNFGVNTSTKPVTAGITVYENNDWVSHPQWGKGQIISVDGSAEAAVLTINFSGTNKKLMAKYAPIRKLAI